ncbi:hypothetical protein ACJJTC_019728 [Scirpophaga incertulas]
MHDVFFIITILVIFNKLQSVGANEKKLSFQDIINENSNFARHEDYCAFRIVGGVEAPITTVPYQVALRRGIYGNIYWTTFCGGSLVTLKFVLTATHCFDQPGFEIWKKSVRAVAGSTLTTVNLVTLYGEQSRKILSFYVHEYYSTITWVNDISVLELERAFFQSNTVKPIRMHVPGLDVDVRDGIKCLVSGYGLVENNKPSKKLRMVCVPLVSSSWCSRIYRTKIFPSVLCAGGDSKDSCLGDSGGPLVCHGVLVGIVSWGGVCGTHPGAYTRVISYTEDEHVSFVMKDGAKLIRTVRLYFVITVYYIVM